VVECRVCDLVVMVESRLTAPGRKAVKPSTEVILKQSKVIRGGG